MRVSRRWCGGSGWRGLVLLLLLLLHSAIAAPVVPKLSKEGVSLCSKTDTPAACVSKVAQCSPLGGLLAPLQGSTAAIIACVNTTGAVLRPEFLAGLGEAVMLGSSKQLQKKPTVDPAANLALRKCILTSSGMLGVDFLLDRAAIAGLVSLLSPPNLGAAVAAAVTTCPEPDPKDLSTKAFTKCIQKACMAGATPPATPPPAGY